MTPAMCLAIAMFFEGRNQGVEGMRVIGEVVVNRKEHKRFPNTICGVVFKNDHKKHACAFSFACDGLSDSMNAFDQPADVKAKKLALTLAQEILAGEKMIADNITHYHTVAVDPYWNSHPNFTFEGKVGYHVFYSCKKWC